MVLPSSREKLTAGEIGVLWGTYIYASTNECMLKYLFAKSEDGYSRHAAASALNYLPARLKAVEAFFLAEDIPVPLAFGDEDVDVTVPRLFSDNFTLDYLRTRGALSVGSLAYALQVAARPDVRKFILEQMTNSLGINNLATEMMLVRGIFVRPPIVAVGRTVSFAGRPDFFGSLLGAERPLTTPEITQLHLNIETNRLGKDLVLGFSQVARSSEVREYCRRGADIAGKHIEIFAKALRREDIPVSSTWDSRVTASTVPPYSDKFMLTHVTLLNSLGLTNYGLALSVSLRADLQADYVRLMAEVMDYAADGMKIAVANSWLEEPPQVIDRRELALR